MKAVYSDDPVEMATAFREGGIEKLHIVDLDASLGCGENSAVYSSIIQTVGIPVQIGGGMRDMDAIARTLESGVAQVILGTAAVEDSGFLRASIKDIRPWADNSFPGRSGRSDRRAGMAKYR